MGWIPSQLPFFAQRSREIFPSVSQRVGTTDDLKMFVQGTDFLFHASKMESEFEELKRPC